MINLPGWFLWRAARQQYKNAPIAGKMMAELVNMESGHDHDQTPLSLPCHIQRQIDIGFYSLVSQ